MQLDICWWNTKLTPPVKKTINRRPSNLLDKQVEDVIDEITKTRAVDLFVFCEVYKQNENLIKKIAVKNQLSYLMLTQHISGVYYDFALLYETTKIKIKRTEFIDEKSGFKQQLRIGVIVDAVFDDVDVSLFISHWNSSMFSGEGKKEYCAGKLRDKIDTHARTANFKKGENLVILIGDYNSQPFDRAITHTLQTSKDVDIVGSAPSILYNPFWRNLDKRSKTHSYSGSYFFKDDDYDKWKTFDQMMFSSDFIHGCSWKLDIYSPEIHDEFNGLNFNFTDIFDHIPIYGRIEK